MRKTSPYEGLRFATLLFLRIGLMIKVVKRCDRVYLEAYTSILLIDKDKLVRIAIYNPSSL